MTEILWYDHHDRLMAVIKDNKGKHRDNSLCPKCIKFKPDYSIDNCEIAETLFAIDKALKVTTPVWECHSFVGKDPSLEWLEEKPKYENFESEPE